MFWLSWLLPLISGVADASKRGLIKITKELHSFTLLGFGFAFALPWYLIWLSAEWPKVVDPEFYIGIAIQVPLLVLAFTLQVEAHRMSDLLMTGPYLALTPVFLLITSPLMGAGNPTTLGMIGVLIITSGIYVLNTKDEQRKKKGVKQGLMAPWRNLLDDKAAWMMIAVAAIFSITANFDYLGWKKSNEPFFLAVAHGLVGVCCLALAAFYWKTGRADVKKLTPRGRWQYLVLFGIITAIMAIPQMLAFRWIANVPYVIVGKRAGFMFGSILVALWLGIFKGDKGELEDLRYRVPGTMIIFLGMVIIILYGKGS